MAFNHHHSASWSEVGSTGTKPDSTAGLSTDTLSWTDIQKAPDYQSGLSSSNYGKKALARVSDSTSQQQPLQQPGWRNDATPAVVNSPIKFGNIQESLPHMHGNESTHYEGLGFAAGVSPFRSIVPGDFFSSAKTGDTTARIAESAAARLGETSTRNGDSAAPIFESSARNSSSPRLNSSLLRVISNLQKQNAGGESAQVLERPLAGKTIESLNGTQSPDAKLAIGLALQPDAEVHDKASVARAKVRLDQEAAQARIEARKAEFAPKLNEEEVQQAKLEQEETRPLADPFRHVFEQHAKIAEKFDGNNCKYGRTTLLPDGRTVTSSTASDNTTLSKTTSENGANSMVVQDRYRRPIVEQITNPDGSWAFSELSYDDSKGIKPFCAEKITVNSDGTMVRSRYSAMGQLESKQLFV